MILESKAEEYVKLAARFSRLGEQINALACALTAVRLNPACKKAHQALDRTIHGHRHAPTAARSPSALDHLVARKRRLDSELLKEVFLPLRPPDAWLVDIAAALNRSPDADESDARERVTCLLARLSGQQTRRASHQRERLAAVARNLGVDPETANKPVQPTSLTSYGGLSLEHEMHNLGNSLYKLGRLDDAVVCYDLALEIQPRLLESHFNKALAATKEGAYENAIEDLDRVIGLKPDLAEVYYTRGLVREYQDRYDDAIKEYDHALEIDPGYERARTQRRRAEEKKTNRAVDTSSNSSNRDTEGRITDFSFCLLRGDASFNDVGGCRDVKHLLRKILYYLQDVPALREWGAQPPRGVLMIGEPGTGKTILARALAAEAHCPCFAPPSTIFQDLWAGNTEKNIRALWKQALSHEKAIIFIDEIDGLLSRRIDARAGTGEAWYNRVVTTLLDLMDGARASRNRLVVIGATNRPENIDKAFLRPGRFDYTVRVPQPTARDLVEIWLIHLRLAARRAKREDFVEHGLERFLHRENFDWLDSAFRQRTAMMPGIVRLARISASHGLTGADVQEIIRRTIDDRAMAAIEWPKINLGPITVTDLLRELESYRQPSDFGGQDCDDSGFNGHGPQCIA